MEIWIPGEKNEQWRLYYKSHKYLIKSGIAKRFPSFQEKIQPLLEENSR